MRARKLTSMVSFIQNHSFNTPFAPLFVYYRPVQLKNLRKKCAGALSTQTLLAKYY